MNIERLHAIVIAVSNELKSNNVEGLLKTLVNSLQNVVNQPQQPQHQNQVSASLTQLNDVLGSSITNDFSPAWKQTLEELDVYDYSGNSLRDSIQEIFKRNQITPATALQELNKILGVIKNINKAFNDITSSFEFLEIGHEELEKGQCEVGMLIPRAAVSNKLNEYSKDLGRIDKLFGVFSELTTKKRPGFEIRSVSSSDFNLMLTMLPVTAASIAFAVDRILSVYKRVLEIRKLHGELKKQGFEEKELQTITKKADSIINAEIKVLKPELLDKYYGNEKKNETRRNELSIELGIALSEIAKRIDKGYNIEIRVPTTEGSEEPSSDQHIKTISTVLKNLEFIKLEGEPVLSLPETIEEDKEE